ncbi:hypothetical protein RRG08_061135 [Elysia crispata]|uniref:Uncharacterized protein n=1 Tax=Elysia crispata TaxID=231223 RepID=A0AAE0XDS5_9GAST|nr:hypothetical protein RRG08_061135 [Elysia crispata]
MAEVKFGQCPPRTLYSNLNNINTYNNGGDEKKTIGRDGLELYNPGLDLHLDKNSSANITTTRQPQAVNYSTTGQSQPEANNYNTTGQSQPEANNYNTTGQSQPEANNYSTTGQSQPEANNYSTTARSQPQANLMTLITSSFITSCQVHTSSKSQQPILATRLGAYIRPLPERAQLRENREAVVSQHQSSSGVVYIDREK